MIIVFIITVKILLLIKWSNRSSQICWPIDPKMVSMFGARSQISLKHICLSMVILRSTRNRIPLNCPYYCNVRYRHTYLTPHPSSTCHASRLYILQARLSKATRIVVNVKKPSQSKLFLDTPYEQRSMSFQVFKMLRKGVPKPYPRLPMFKACSGELRFYS